MKKKILMRGLFGLPTGIAIGFVITLIISICIGNGSFYPVTPELIDATGNELNAVILQTVLCAIMGAGFAAASIVWELDSWSLAKQSGKMCIRDRYKADPCFMKALHLIRF